MRRILYDYVRVAAYTSGTAIDRQGLLSAVIGAKISSITGSPTAAKMTVALTHCDTSGGAYTAVDDNRALPDGSEYTVDVTDGLEVMIPIDLIGCKRYVKVTLTITYTGGTSPSATTAYAYVLGDGADMPV